MARSRNIKPGFFLNEELGELPALTRLLFVALWTQADREGRLADRPKRIKAQALPYDDEVDVDAALAALDHAGFIHRYQVEGERYIQVTNFLRHQNPHCKEQCCTIPAPEMHGACTVQAPDIHDKSRADSLIPLMDSFQNRSACADQFDAWWTVYPKKRKKKEARAVWISKNLNQLADRLIADIRLRIAKDGNWQEVRFIPDPAGYLFGERWTDSLTPLKETTNGSASLSPPKRDEELEEWAVQNGFKGAQPGETYLEFRKRLMVAGRGMGAES